MEVERLRVEIGQARGHDGAPRTDQSRSWAGGASGAGCGDAGSPPSQNSEPAGKDGDASRKPSSEHKKSGREKGHPGSTNKPRSTFTVRYVLEKCESCGSENITRGTSSKSRQATEIPSTPKAETGTHVACDGVCGDCGGKVASPDLEDRAVWSTARHTDRGWSERSSGCGTAAWAFPPLGVPQTTGSTSRSARRRQSTPLGPAPASSCRNAGA